MLPSMPILFTRDSQDAFGNKIEPSTSFFSRDSPPKAVAIAKPSSQKIEEVPRVTQQETQSKEVNTNKKDQGKNDPSKLNDNALEAALVRSYYTKVQSRFASNQTVPTNKFVQFQNILKSFDPNKETPANLYKKIEQLFGEEHKDIVEEFLLFLKPGQAAEVGRFMDHFILTQMTSFIELIQNTFARKPTVLRKILRALTTGINSGNSEVMKTRVLPHLRSSPRLAQMFKSLFPDERPPDSVYETGTDTLNESFLTVDKGYDVWEFEEEGDNKRNLDVKQNLDTMYLHGRVFLQHGRMLRTASVTYPYSIEPYRVHARRLAPIQCHLSPPNSDEEKSSPKKNSKTPKIPPKRTKKQVKSPTKNIKDVNDNTKHKDCTANVTSSPKTVRGKAQSRNKSKDKVEGKPDSVHKKDKKDKHDNKINTTDHKRDEGSKAKQARLEGAPNSSEVTHEIRTNSWTREEDKTMLQVLKGEAGSEQVFGRIRELLPHRSVSEIKDRFCHVMVLLQQMAVGEVT